MRNVYFEALYNENRNAIPSWQGYLYQGEVAVYKFLNYILQQFLANSESISLTCIKIEWLEDFVIFEGEEVKQIYQVKKTLTNSDYDDVIQNFILQFKLINDDSCEWIIVYNDVAKDELESVLEENFRKLFQDFINEAILSELSQLQENRSNLEFWKEHLSLKNGDSKLSKTRGLIRKLLDEDSVQFKRLNVQDCEAFIDNHLNEIIMSLQQKEDDYSKFNIQVKFEKTSIDSIKSNSINIINQLVDGNYLKKNDIMQSGDIFDTLYIRLYEILMKIKNKKTESFIITFKDIQEIFLSSNKMELLWKDQVYKAREEMIKRISRHCEKCSTKDCVGCQITAFLDLEFCELIDNCNLEYPKVKPEAMAESLRNKLSKEKSSHLINMLTKYTESINCLEKSNFVELTKNNSKMFLSQNISDDHEYNRIDLISNINEHLDVYNEYSCILTKHFSDEIAYEHTKIVKNTEFINADTPPTFMDVLPITFKSKECLEEE